MKIQSRYNDEKLLTNFRNNFCIAYNSGELKITEGLFKLIKDNVVKRGFVWLYKTITESFPPSSDQYMAIRDLMNESIFFEAHGHEYSLCLFKSGGRFFQNTKEFNNINISTMLEHYGDVLFVPRYTSEWNPVLLQFSVGCLIIDESCKKALVLKAISGNFKDQYTLVQGHASYDPRTDFTGLQELPDFEEIDNYFYQEMLKELGEETTFNEDMFIEKVSTIFIPVITDNIYDISFYHSGPVYVMKARLEDMMNTVSGEPLKHKCEIVDIEVLRNETTPKDAWLTTLISKLSV